jgi:hypothetical protein
MEELISYIPREYIDFIETEIPWAVDVFYVIKYFCIIFTVILLIAFILVLLQYDIRGAARMAFQGADIPKSSPSKVQKIWRNILKRLDSKDSEAYKLAVIEAEKFFNEMLETLGYKGKDFEERMGRISPDGISDSENIYQAHQTAEKIIKDSNFELSLGKAKNILENFEKALKEINVL